MENDTHCLQIRLDENGRVIVDEATLTVTAQQSEVDTYRCAALALCLLSACMRCTASPALPRCC